MYIEFRLENVIFECHTDEEGRHYGVCGALGLVIDGDNQEAMFQDGNEQLSALFGYLISQDKLHEYMGSRGVSVVVESSMPRSPISGAALGPWHAPKRHSIQYQYAS